MRLPSLLCAALTSTLCLTACAELDCTEDPLVEELDLESLGEEEWLFLDGTRSELRSRGHGDFVFPVEITTEQDGSMFGLWAYEREWFRATVFVPSEESQETLDLQLGDDDGERALISQADLRRKLAACGPGFELHCDAALYLGRGPQYADEKDSASGTWTVNVDLLSGEVECFEPVDGTGS